MLCSYFDDTISAHPQTSLCGQFLDKEKNAENNRSPSGDRFYLKSKSKKFYLKRMEIHKNLSFSTKTPASSIKTIIFKSFHSQQKNEK